MPRTTTIQIQGREYEVREDNIRQVARTHNPERRVGYYIEVEGKKFPPVVTTWGEAAYSDAGDSSDANIELRDIALDARNQSPEEGLAT